MIYTPLPARVCSLTLLTLSLALSQSPRTRGDVLVHYTHTGMHRDASTCNNVRKHTLFLNRARANNNEGVRDKHTHTSTWRTWQ